jgi:hypothetical protein
LGGELAKAVERDQPDRQRPPAALGPLDLDLELGGEGLERDRLGELISQV